MRRLLRPILLAFMLYLWWPAAGLWLWNGMGKHFGIDRAALKPTRKISEGTPPA